MIKFLKKNIYIGLIIIVVLIFFYKTLLSGLLPIPSDTIAGLYYPFRDEYVKDYPNGIPFKNFLITDPVRQQYPWKKLTVEVAEKKELPLWNPYEMAGKPLLANFQSGFFYVLNFVFLLKPFYLAWSLFIILQPLLGAIFLYLFLNNMRLDKKASFLGSIVFAFSGFSIVWLEWGNVLHSAIWLPLILLSIDKMMNTEGRRIQLRHFIWSLVFGTALQASFFAGHLQTFFYVFIFSVIYFLARWFQKERDKKHFFLFILSIILFFAGTFLQSIPTLKFISLSARGVDQSMLTSGWFIPWQNLIQFLAPDFFGNPSTLNYWGVWNYAEFVGYIGIFPLIMALFALFFRRDKKTFFFIVAFLTSLIFALPTVFAKIPFNLELPFVSTAQPTRLLFIADFSLSVLAAFGLDLFIKNKKGTFYVLGSIGFAFFSLWLFVLNYVLKNPDLLVSKQNLIFPSAIFAVSFILISLSFIKSKKSVVLNGVIYLLIILTLFDLFRFGWKFTPFTDKKYLYPKTQVTSFLQKQKGEFRVMSSDSRILPPNFSTIYKISSIDGYDPLYLLNYGEFIAASERGEPNISGPFGFNRIITPQNYSSDIIDLLGVKYILSLSDLSSSKLKLVLSFGKTKIYENENVFPRTFFVKNTINASSKQEEINLVFSGKEFLKTTAVVSGYKSSEWSLGSSKIKSYKENEVIIETENTGNGFLVLIDSFYPTWKAEIDGKETRIYKTDYNFRGVTVLKGKHIIKFSNSLI